MMSPSHNIVEVGAVGVGALVGLGQLLALVQPFLADVSYAAAIIVAGVTVYYKIKNKGK
jgi:hypothetical protein